MKKLWILFLVLVSYQNSWGWDNEKIHPLITDYAANYFFDPATLTSSVTLPGIFVNTTQTALYWLEQGAIHEDDFTRPVNHFYAPTKSTIESGGLTDFSFFTGFLLNYIVGIVPEAAPLWEQDYSNQQTYITGDWSWNAVRNYEYNYLTARNDTDEGANFANMLQGLGHQLHLIQDMSQPAHVRNNAHLIDGFGLGGIETWAKKYAKVNTNPCNTSINSILANTAPDPPQVTVDLTQQVDQAHPQSYLKYHILINNVFIPQSMLLHFFKLPRLCPNTSTD